MSRVYALTVVLDDDVMGGDVADLVYAIKLLRGVTDVRSNDHNPQETSARIHAKQEILRQMEDWLGDLE